MNPDANERMAARCIAKMVAASGETLQRYWWNRALFYLKRRPPEIVERMERKMGLAHS